jgi:hypothetical protein
MRGAGVLEHLIDDAEIHADLQKAANGELRGAGEETGALR